MVLLAGEATGRNFPGMNWRPNRVSSSTGTAATSLRNPQRPTCRALVHLTGWLLSGLAVVLPLQGQTLYQLVEGSEWMPAGDAPTVPVRGSFRLVPLPGPLDWEVFAVERVYLETRSEGSPPRVWHGSGRYQRGGRGPFFGEQMWLVLDDGSGPIRLDSGLQPVRTEQDLDLVLQSEIVDGPAVHLRAVPELSRWTYRTVADTRFVNACIVCGLRTIPVPLRGGFELVHSGDNPLFQRYHVFNLRLTDGAEPPGVEITGEGTVEIGGEVAVQQKWNLTLRVRLGGEGRTATFVNTDPVPSRLRPMISADLEEQGGNEFSRFYVSLRAAPFRELWFTTHNGMTPGTKPRPGERLTGADILSDTGRLVVAGSNLLKGAGLPADLGVDGFDVIPGGGGAVAFTVNQAAASERLGPVSEGDLLASDGRVLRRNAELVGRLGFMPPPPDLGLDAVFRHESGEYWFSVRGTAWSETLGRMIGPGDLLSDAGRVVRAHTELLARFAPPDPERDYGLDAFYVWPSGEIWFSVEEGFQDAGVGQVMDGDLLSDQGYVVARNLDLVAPFQPLEDLANFGLQGLWVVSDAVALKSGPQLARPVRTAAGLELTWSGAGRAYLVEHAAGLEEPFGPLSPIVPESRWTVPVNQLPSARAFYRLRAW